MQNLSPAGEQKRSRGDQENAESDAPAQDEEKEMNISSDDQEQGAREEGDHFKLDLRYSGTLQKGKEMYLSKEGILAHADVTVDIDQLSTYAPALKGHQIIQSFPGGDKVRICLPNLVDRKSSMRSDRLLVAMDQQDRSVPTWIEANRSCQRKGAPLSRFPSMRLATGHCGPFTHNIYIVWLNPPAVRTNMFMAYQQDVIVAALNRAELLLQEACAAAGVCGADRSRTSSHFYRFQSKKETKDEDSSQQRYINNRLYGEEAAVFFKCFANSLQHAARLSSRQRAHVWEITESQFAWSLCCSGLLVSSSSGLKYTIERITLSSVLEEREKEEFQEYSNNKLLRRLVQQAVCQKGAVVLRELLSGLASGTEENESVAWYADLAYTLHPNDDSRTFLLEQDDAVDACERLMAGSTTVADRRLGALKSVLDAPTPSFPTDNPSPPEEVSQADDDDSEDGGPVTGIIGRLTCELNKMKEASSEALRLDNEFLCAKEALQQAIPLMEALDGAALQQDIGHLKLLVTSLATQAFFAKQRSVKAADAAKRLFEATKATRLSWEESTQKEELDALRSEATQLEESFATVIQSTQRLADDEGRGASVAQLVDRAGLLAEFHSAVNPGCVLPGEAATASEAVATFAATTARVAAAAKVGEVACEQVDEESDEEGEWENGEKLSRNLNGEYAGDFEKENKFDNDGNNEELQPETDLAAESRVEKQADLLLSQAEEDEALTTYLTRKVTRYAGGTFINGAGNAHNQSPCATRKEGLCGNEAEDQSSDDLSFDPALQHTLSHLPSDLLLGVQAYTDGLKQMLMRQDSEIWKSLGDLPLLVAERLRANDVPARSKKKLSKIMQGLEVLLPMIAEDMKRKPGFGVRTEMFCRVDGAVRSGGELLLPHIELPQFLSLDKAAYAEMHSTLTNESWGPLCKTFLAEASNNARGLGLDQSRVSAPAKTALLAHAEMLAWQLSDTPHGLEGSVLKTMKDDFEHVMSIPDKFKLEITSREMEGLGLSYGLKPSALILPTLAEALSNNDALIGSTTSGHGMAPLIALLTARVSRSRSGADLPVTLEIGLVKIKKLLHAFSSIGKGGSGCLLSATFVG